MQVGARECLVTKQDLQNKNFKLVLDRSNILVTECAKGITNPESRTNNLDAR